MQARAPLMIEHRLIERVIAVVNRTIPRIRPENTVDPVFAAAVVDFFHAYVDLVHHGKEEKIMFRDLDGKSITEHDRTVMNELIEDHAFARKITRETADAVDRYGAGDIASIPAIVSGLSTFADFYPKHIEKEDKVFFPAYRAYLSEQEDQAMLEEFREFDRRMIHDVYRERVATLEKQPDLAR